MQVKRLISRRIRKAGQGIDLAADVHAVVSVNVQETRRPATSRTSTEPPAAAAKRDARLDNEDTGRETA